MEPIDRFHALIVCSVLLGSPVAAAQSVPGAHAPAFAAHASVPAPIAAGSSEDATAAATSIDTAGRAAAGDTIADMLAEVPGARPYRTGTLGSFTAASLRGADIDHSAVLLGDLPISGADAAAFDLSTIPTALVERVVVYRGGAPVWLSQGAIGGIVQLVPRQARARELSATGSVGSFGLWGISADAALVPERRAHGPSLYSSAGVTGSEGDFAYPDDNRTPLDPGDDYVARRKNADALDGHGLFYLRQPAFGGHLDVAALGFERVAGEPVSPANFALRARRNHTRAIGIASWQRDAWSGADRRYRVQALAGASIQRTRFTDLFNEVGDIGQQRTDDRSERGFARLAGSVGATRWLELTALASAQREGFDPENAFARVAVPDSRRDTVAGAGEVNLHGALLGRRFELRPSVRYEHTSARLESERFLRLVSVDTSLGAPTYRVGAVVEAMRGVALSASAATGRRVPTMLELFGDGALIAGNPRLAPEHAVLLDVGITGTGTVGELEGSVSLRGFHTSIDGLVIWRRSNFNEQSPYNLGSGEILGLEAGLVGRAGRHASLTAALTILDTEGKPGKELPLRARYTALVRPEVEFALPRPLDGWMWFVEARVVGPSYEEPDNVVPASRTQAFADIGAAVFALGRAAALRITIRDLFDRGGFDLHEFQLPGRMLFASIHYKENV